MKKEKMVETIQMIIKDNDPEKKTPDFNVIESAIDKEEYSDVCGSGIDFKITKRGESYHLINYKYEDEKK